MKKIIRDARAPILFFQAENDYDLSPSRSLSQEMKEARKVSELKLYPPYGKTPAEGHKLRVARQLGLGRRCVSFSGTALPKIVSQFPTSSELGCIRPRSAWSAFPLHL